MPEKEANEAIEKFLSAIGDKMKGVMDARNMNATGRSRGLIEQKVANAQGTLYGPRWILQLEQGRGPTRNKTASTPTLRQQLERWAIAKGIANQQNAKGIAYVIARKIHALGTQLHRNGGRTGILSETITKNEIQTFLETFAKDEMGRVLGDVFVRFKTALK